MLSTGFEPVDAAFRESIDRFFHFPQDVRINIEFLWGIKYTSRRWVVLVDTWAWLMSLVNIGRFLPADTASISLIELLATVGE